MTSVLGRIVPRNEVVELEAIELDLDFIPSRIEFGGDELTAICPVTGQPDFYTWAIDIIPGTHTIESKSLKLWLGQLRSIGVFCESLAPYILGAVVKCINPKSCSVIVVQKPRGGISIKAEAHSG